MFKPLISCVGMLMEEKPTKIRFRQNSNKIDCWINKSELNKIVIGPQAPSGWKSCQITISEELASIMELQGQLE
jgi:hypothetical protein